MAHWCPQSMLQKTFTFPSDSGSLCLSERISQCGMTVCVLSHFNRDLAQWKYLSSSFHSRQKPSSVGVLNILTVSAFSAWSFHFHNGKLGNWRQWQGLCAPCHSTRLLVARVGHLMTVTEGTGLIYVMTASVPSKEMPE